MVVWLRSWTLQQEVAGSYPPVTAVVPFCKAHYPHCLVPLKGFKVIGPLVAYHTNPDFCCSWNIDEIFP